MPQHQFSSCSSGLEQAGRDAAPQTPADSSAAGAGPRSCRPNRTRTARRHDPAGPTLEEALRTMRDRHETLLWLGPTLLLVAAIAGRFLA